MRYAVSLLIILILVGCAKPYPVPSLHYHASFICLEELDAVYTDKQIKLLKEKKYLTLNGNILIVRYNHAKGVWDVYSRSATPDEYKAHKHEWYFD